MLLILQNSKFFYTHKCCSSVIATLTQLSSGWQQVHQHVIHKMYETSMITTTVDRNNCRAVGCVL